MSVWSWKVKSKLIWLLPSAPCVYKESDPRNGHWIADILSLPCHYLSLPSGAFGVPWRGWPEKEWIVSYPDPPSRQLFIEAVPQENYRNRFKMITETPTHTPFILSPHLHLLSSYAEGDKIISQPTPRPSVSPNYPRLVSPHSDKAKFTFEFWILNMSLELGNISYRKPSERSLFLKWW